MLDDRNRLRMEDDRVRHEHELQKCENGLRHKIVKSPLPKVLPISNGGRKKVGRNLPCPCGSGKKFKFCCLPVLNRSTQESGK